MCWASLFTNTALTEHMTSSLYMAGSLTINVLQDHMTSGTAFTKSNEKKNPTTLKVLAETHEVCNRAI